MPTFDPRSTALILIDLQQGVVPMGKAPRTGEAVVAACKALASEFRKAAAPVVLVHVTFDPANMPSQAVDTPGIPPDGTPPGWGDLVPGLRQPGDLVVLKHHWGAFIGTDLDLQLRRRGCRTAVIAGLVTNMGVESTARSAWELSYDVVIVEDCTATLSEDMHAFAIEKILPNIARVLGSGDIRFA